MFKKLLWALLVIPVFISGCFPDRAVQDKFDNQVLTTTVPVVKPYSGDTYDVLVITEYEYDNIQFRLQKYAEQGWVFTGTAWSNTRLVLYRKRIK